MRTKWSLLALLLVLILPTSLYSLHEPKGKSQILRDEDIRIYDEPIYEFTRARLLEEFGPGRVYPINLTLVTKNIVWQVREAIHKGEQKPITGIIRTFWYTHIKPVFARADSLSKESDQSEILSEVLVELVRDRNLMRYKDMGFADKNKGTQKIGQNWHLILVGEKLGQYEILEKIANELQCSVITLGGQPSLLSMEYFVDRYKEKGINTRKSIYVIFIVDYDPSGWIIRDSVLTDLKFYGMSNIQPIDIIFPEILSSKELELAKFELRPTQETINEKWLERTGGLNGKAFGFESDSVPFERLREKIIEVSRPYIGNSEVIRRSNTTIKLSESLKTLSQILLGLIRE